MRVDEGRKCRNLLWIKMKARTVAGRGEESLLCDPGSDLRVSWKEREKKMCEDNKWHEKKKMALGGTILNRMYVAHRPKPRYLAGFKSNLWFYFLWSMVPP